MRNNSYKLNWYYEQNIQEANNTKILSKYNTFRHPNGWQWPMTATICNTEHDVKDCTRTLERANQNRE